MELCEEDSYEDILSSPPRMQQADFPKNKSPERKRKREEDSEEGEDSEDEEEEDSEEEKEDSEGEEDSGDDEGTEEEDNKNTQLTHEQLNLNLPHLNPDLAEGPADVTSVCQSTNRPRPKP
ncbi:hypothetical protein MATL_G00023150 [Megalops atlanticus]|uniref:Uncharacterized protein n=1 Tax=Megalops atlanticus TaxID=7932 RepID=A0A9D3QBH4_MEGAT|nr:hypothetical protein MATL_G00023150 [Megalops atlanticus]